MVGLADVFKEIRAERGNCAGERLFTWLDSKEPEQLPPIGPDGLIRISSLGNFCPREEVLAARHEIIRVKKIDPSLSITFDIGNLLHDLFRNFYFGPLGEWRGAWKCSRCEWDTDGAGLSHPPKFVKNGDRYKVKIPKLAMMPLVCPECGAEAANGRYVRDESSGWIVFKEWNVEDPQVGIGGHPDGWIVCEGKKPRIVDIKSISANQFKRLTKYKEDHVLQVWGYQHCCGCTETQGSVLYVNKSPWGDHTAFVREFFVPQFDKDVFNQQVRVPVDSMRNGINGGALPEPVCVSKDCNRSLECQLVNICFES